MDTLRDLFNDKLTAHTAAQAAAKAATADKLSTRATVEKQIRDIRNLCKANNVDLAKMTALGIPTTTSASPATVTVPAALVDTSQRLLHTISWSDAAANGNKKKRAARWAQRSG